MIYLHFEIWGANKHFLFKIIILLPNLSGKCKDIAQVTYIHRLRL